MDYVCQIGTSNALYFSSLLITPLDPPVAEAAKQIPAVRETVAALAAVKEWIDKSGPETAHLQHLFRLLLDKQWSENMSLALELRAGEIVAERLGYALQPVDERLLLDLLEVADELSGVPDAPILTGKEETILESMEGEIFTGRQIAEKAGFEYNSSFRSYLSQMAKRHLIVKVKGRVGYKSSRQ